MNIIRLSVVLSALASVCLTATAVPVYDVSIGSSSITGTLTGETHTMKYTGMGYKRTGSFICGDYKSNTYAGELMFQYDGTPNNVAWCVDVYQNVSSSNKKYDVASVTNNGYLNAIDSLYYQYTRYVSAMAGKTSALNIAAAAFQLTLWEATFEKEEYDLNSGWFTAAADGANELAEEWLAGIEDIDASQYEKEFLVNKQHQDIVIFGKAVTPNVPEPLTMTCFALGFIGVGGYLRKRLKDEA